MFAASDPHCRLGHREGGDRLAAGDLRQPFALLLDGPEQARSRPSRGPAWRRRNRRAPYGKRASRGRWRGCARRAGDFAVGDAQLEETRARQARAPERGIRCRDLRRRPGLSAHQSRSSQLAVRSSKKGQRESASPSVSEWRSVRRTGHAEEGRSGISHPGTPASAWPRTLRRRAGNRWSACNRAWASRLHVERFSIDHVPLGVELPLGHRVRERRARARAHARAPAPRRAHPRRRGCRSPRRALRRRSCRGR